MSEPASSEEQRKRLDLLVDERAGRGRRSTRSSPPGRPTRKVNDMSVDNFVAGSDEDGTATVIELIWSIGMRPIDAGHLSSARILEAMGA
jgi:hypothetical protein